VILHIIPLSLNKCSVAIDGDCMITDAALLRSPEKQPFIIACRPGTTG